jgi:hypothetical protein
MYAKPLKFADDKPTGIWYCGRCREIFRGCVTGSEQGRWVPSSETHQRQAEACCTGNHLYMNCTGCRKSLKQCVCGRAQKNLCVACGTKLFFKEGSKVRWGADIREVCYECSKKKALAAMLVDAPK